MSSNSEEAKRIAAYRAVDEVVTDNCVLGIGSGSTIIHAVKRLRQRVERENLKVICVPTSFQAKQLIIKHKLTLGDLDINPVIDVTIDGADEVDSNLNLIKGGGACLLQEKIVASCSKKLIIIADYTKDSAQLGDKYVNGLPIEVVPMAYVPISNKIVDLYGGQVTLRKAVAKAGPVVTDHGNFILDWSFKQDNRQPPDWLAVNNTLAQIPGLIETGLFVNMCNKVYFGQREGTVITKTK